MSQSYLPHTEADRRIMLETIGVKTVDDLFACIPESVRLNRPLHLPAPMAEPDLVRHLRRLAAKNGSLEEYACFLGAGAYDHYIPSTVGHVIGRSEFYTAYTQYQPEIAQGYLQALWEYQSMICEITGMPVANASLYDGGSAMAEAAMMACTAVRRSEIVVAKTVHPHYRAVLSAYAVDLGYPIREVGYDDGLTDAAQLEQVVGTATAAVIIQSPNFFGSIEDIKALADMAHAKGAYLIAAADPVSLALLEAPGRLGADIVIGEGQSLGLPVGFGGPYLGFFAVTEKLMRKMPGRIVGQTVDQEGRRGFVLTLQAREQHIRREKATSNICSNEALCALTADVYLSTVGRQGFRTVAELSLQKAHYAFNELTRSNACRKVFSAPFFKEFAVCVNKPVADMNDELLKGKIIGGLDLGKYYPELENCMLLCVTENRTKEEIDRLVGGMGALV